MDIPAPPSPTFCAGCLEQVVWHYSPRVEDWVAFVPCPCGGRWALQPHGCREIQNPRVWRELPHGDPPSAEYLEVKSKIASKESG